MWHAQGGCSVDVGKEHGSSRARTSQPGRPYLSTLFRIPCFQGPSDFGPIKLKPLARQAWCFVRLSEARECGEEKHRVQHNPSNTHGHTARTVHQSSLSSASVAGAWGDGGRGSTLGDGKRKLPTHRPSPCCCSRNLQVHGVLAAHCWLSAISGRPATMAVGSGAQQTELGRRRGIVVHPHGTNKANERCRPVVVRRFGPSRKVGTHAEVGALRCLRRVRVQGRGLQGCQTRRIAAVALA